MDVKLYYLSYCPYCNKLKSFLESQSIDFELVDVTNNPEEKEKIKQQTGHKTFPQFIINDTFVGDYSSTTANFNQIKEEYKL